MTWVDLVVLGVLAVSALLAFMRGFVREVLGIGAWVAAVLVAIWAFPYARPHFREWLGTPDLVDPVTFAVVFIVTLLILLLVFGLIRGAALVVFAYIAAGLVIPVDRWPDPVLHARSLPVAYAGAAWAAAQLPPDYRPKLQPPPAGRQTTAEDLLRATPQGRATSRPLARD